MKYGLIVEFGAKCSNFGDYVQSIAIEYLYTEIMGIPKDEIVHITCAALSTYDGEELILPYSYVMHLFVFPEYKKVKLSPKIHLVFLICTLFTGQSGKEGTYHFISRSFLCKL